MLDVPSMEGLGATRKYELILLWIKSHQTQGITDFVNCAPLDS